MSELRRADPANLRCSRRPGPHANPDGASDGGPRDDRPRPERRANPNADPSGPPVPGQCSTPALTDSRGPRVECHVSDCLPPGTLQ